VGQHRSASASRLLGLDGFQVVSAELVGGEWQLAVQTTATWSAAWAAASGPSCTAAARSGCATCPAGGRPVGLLWHKRIWRCREPACGVRTWTERAAAIRLGRC
jgi:transposase